MSVANLAGPRPGRQHRPERYGTALTQALGEFRHQTATLTHLATPGRTWVLAAKTIAAAGAVFWLVGYGVGHLMADALLGAFGAPFGSLVPLAAVAARTTVRRDIA